MLFQCSQRSKQIPLRKILIHGLIRDSQNRKMSKSLGNGIDPMDVIDKYGTDALRMFLTSTASLGEDLRYDEEKIVFYSNFFNKI
ncbi:MAG: class I tRNA ligase family protein [Mycoplasmoidaceae bacterium]|nr:class I tRNA ligase family protein [Mycoplasmoidaceae bacterium]